MTASDWAVGQPDNLGGAQNCLALFGDTVIFEKPSQEWLRFDDDDCGAARGYICEKTASPAES